MSHRGIRQVRGTRGGQPKEVTVIVATIQPSGTWPGLGLGHVAKAWGGDPTWGSNWPTMTKAGHWWVCRTNLARLCGSWLWWSEERREELEGRGYPARGSYGCGGSKHSWLGLFPSLAEGKVLRMCWPWEVDTGGGRLRADTTTARLGGGDRQWCFKNRAGFIILLLSFNSKTNNGFHWRI